MKYCLECGDKLEKGSRFCIHCGATIESEADGSKLVQNTVSKQEEPFPKQVSSVNSTNSRTERVKKPMSKKTKVIGSIVIIVCVLLFGTHKWLEGYYDPMKQLVAMDEAISNDDSEGFIKYIDFDDNAILDEQSYFEYIRDHEWDDNMKDSYQTIIENEKLESSVLDKEITTAYQDDVLFKVKNKKHLGFYPGFTLKAIPTEIELYVNMDDATISFHDEELELKDNDEPVEMGKVYPGIYEVNGEAKSEYGDFALQDEVEVFGVDYMDLSFEFDYVTAEINPSYDFPDALLYIDGEKTDHTLDDYIEIGPLPEDKDMKFYAEWTNENKDIVRSDTIHLKDLDDYYGIYFDFDETKVLNASVTEESKKEKDKEQKKEKEKDKDNDTKDNETTADGEEAGQFVLEFRNAYEDAVNEADFAEVDSYLKEGTEAKEELSTFIGDMGDADYYYDFEENTVLDVKQDGDKFTVKTNEKFYFIDDDGEEYDYDRDKNYTIELVGDTFQITNIDYADTKKNKAN